MVPKGEVALFRVVVSAPRMADGAEPISDEELATRLNEVREQLAGTLQSGVREYFGPGFELQISHIRPTESVELALLVTAYAATTTPAPLSQILPPVAGRLARATLTFLEARLNVIAAAYAEWDQLVAGSASDESAGGWESIAPVLGAIGTGVGVVGFVTFVGGAVEYARLSAAGLPAETALAVVPTQDLVVIGAKTLVPALAAAVITTAALVVWFIVTRRVGSSARLEQTPLRRAWSVALLALAAELLFFAFSFEGRAVLELLVFLLVSVGTVAVVFHIALTTERLPWLATVIFLSLGVFVAVLAVARASSDARVRPAAAVRANDQASIGFFVAQTGDRVYLGRLDVTDRGREFKRERSRIIVFRNDQITDLIVGPSIDAPKALGRASELADELCREEIARDQRGTAGDAADQSQQKPGEAAARNEPSDKQGKSDTDDRQPLRCWHRPAGRNPLPRARAQP